MAGDNRNHDDRPPQSLLSTPSASDHFQPPGHPEQDEFGLDLKYVRRCSRTLLAFLSKYYWRIEVTGQENLLREGRAILVGTHRGFIPWDGIMAVHLVLQQTGRVPRFLSHPGLLKFSLIAGFVRKFGGVLACEENAERILHHEELLGIFPEGVQGAFAVYRDAYKLKRFGRDSFVKLALRYRAPIIPFVTVGSVEALPVFAQIKSRRWTRFADWPCIPVSTFPFLPFPLPSKWHTRFLAPVQLAERYAPEAAGDFKLVRAISEEVRSSMQQAVDEILKRRPSIFYGSVFRSF